MRSDASGRIQMRSDAFGNLLKLTNNGIAQKISEHPGIIRGSFGGCSGFVQGSFDVVRKSFGVRLGVVRGSFRVFRGRLRFIRGLFQSGLVPGKVRDCSMRRRIDASSCRRIDVSTR